jgi:hypothetical protein
LGEPRGTNAVAMGSLRYKSNDIESGDLKQGEWKNNSLNGKGCITENGDIFMGTFEDGRLNDKEPFCKVIGYSSNKYCSDRIEMIYKTPNDQVAMTINRSDLFNWLFEDGKISNIPEDMKQFIKELIPYVVYKGNPIQHGVPSEGSGAITVNDITYEGTFQNCLLHGLNCKKTYLGGAVENGAFEYGQLIEGVRIYPLLPGLYSLYYMDLCMLENSSHRTTQFYQTYGTFDVVKKNLTDAASEINNETESSEKNKKLELIAKAEDILENIEEKRNSESTVKTK